MHWTIRPKAARKAVRATRVNSVTVSERTLIKNLAASADGPVSVSGWVETVRDQKKVQFVVLRDESGAVQLVHPRPFADDGSPLEDSLAEEISGLSQGTFLTATGELKHDERVKLGGVEIKLDPSTGSEPGGLVIASVAIAETPIAADSSLDKRMDWRFLDLRRPEQNLVFRVQTTFEHALRTYWVENDFIELHTPKLMASASESKAELFEVKYFEGKAFLAQSPQFFKQMAQPAGFGAGLAGVEHQVGHHLGKLFPIERQAGQGARHCFDHEAGVGGKGGQDLRHDRIQVRVDGRDFQLGAQLAEAADQVIDVCHGLAHAAQRILPERRVVKVIGQILQHQVERRGSVLEVVHEKRRHRLERLVLASLE